ncbi:MAG TPA: hypothetical protein PLE80_05445 [Opitutaceae bacterium]|nr:hypothetical protein [Opitutaceae bacterium]
MFHCNQGLILFLVCLVIWIPMVIIGLIPFIGFIIWFVVAPLVCLGLFVLMILGIINAAKGVCKPLPLLGTLFTLVK